MVLVPSQDSAVEVPEATVPRLKNRLWVKVNPIQKQKQRTK